MCAKLQCKDLCLDGHGGLYVESQQMGLEGEAGGSPEIKPT